MGDLQDIFQNCLSGCSPCGAEGVCGGCKGGLGGEHCTPLETKCQVYQICQNLTDVSGLVGSVSGVVVFS